MSWKKPIAILCALAVGATVFMVMQLAALIILASSLGGGERMFYAGLILFLETGVSVLVIYKVYKFLIKKSKNNSPE